MIDYQTAKHRVIQLLENCIQAHKEGRYKEIGAEYEEVYDELTNGAFSRLLNEQKRAHMNNLGYTPSLDKDFQDTKKNLGPKFKKLFFALDVVNQWMDSRNHDWGYAFYGDWPTAGQSLVGALRNDEEPNLTKEDVD